MFDFANSCFSVLVITFLFPLYYREHIVGSATHGDSLWGFTMSASMLLVAVIAPLLGAMADVLQNKKLFLGLFTALTIVCTSALYFVQPGMIFVASALLVLANAGFEGGLVFYDAFLPEITTPKYYGRVSGYGYATGYVGSLGALVMVMILLSAGTPQEAERLSLPLTSLWFFIFALPMFFLVKEHRRPGRRTQHGIVRSGFGQLMSTFRKIRQYRNVARFLLAFFLYNDAILTVIMFSGSYAKTELNFSLTELAMFFAMIQIVAVIGSLVFGKISDIRGPKFSIVITLLIWIAVALLAYFATSKDIFWGVGVLAAVALGSSQSASRTLMARLTPEEHTSEFFGFYEGFCGKASAIIGPIIFGVLSDAFQNPRPAIASLAVFFIAGLLILRGVNEGSAEREEQRIELEMA
jgi:UMF1 family MFS transporter